MRRLLTPGWLARHALALALVAGCLALGGWQWSRATGGNTLSWAYTVQWPLFALFVVYMWVRAARDALGVERPGPASRPEPLRPMAPAAPPSTAVADDPELTAYNAYLAWLAANPDRRPSEYPG